MKKLLLIIPLLVLPFAYFGWTSYSLMSFADAVKNHDIVRIEQKVEWPSFRASINDLAKNEIQKKIKSSNNFLAQLGAQISFNLLEQVIKEYATPDGLVLLLTAKDKIKHLQAEKQNRLDLSNYTFINGFSSLIVSLDNGVIVRFDRQGLDWKLTEVLHMPKLGT